MNVEIAICSFNRARLLHRTLLRISEINSSVRNSVRLIVVNNNSTDETDQVISEFAAKLNILALQEKQQGQVFARNCAIRAAEGDLLIWTDDDVIVGDDWLIEYVSAATGQPGYSFWGGPIRPMFESPEPAWITDNWEKLSGCFAERKLGKESFDLTADRLPYGANFAIRTPVQKKHLFAENLGRTNASVMGEDETSLMRRLLKIGLKGSWLPNCVVDHMIDSSRMTTEFIGNYFRGQGRALVLKGQHWTNDASQLKKEMKHELACYAAKRYFAKSEVWLSHLLRGSLAQGQFEALEIA